MRRSHPHRSAAPAARSLTRSAQRARSAVPSRAWPLALAGVALVALAVRLFLLWRARDLVLSLARVLDSRFYIETARAIASGGAFPDAPFFMSPGYTMFVLVHAALFGDPTVPVILVQVAMDAATCVLTAWLAARLFGHPVGLLAGLLLALHAPMALASLSVLPETPAGFLMALLALALVRLHGRPGPGIAAAAGLLLGAICLLRGNAILVLPVLLVSVALRREGTGPRAALSCAGAVLAGFLLAVLPVTAFNAVRGHDGVLISSNGGVNFYIGNAVAGDGRMMSLNDLPLAPGQFLDDPTGGRLERSVHAYAERSLGRPLTASQVSTFWFREGLAEVVRAPRAWAGLLLRKMYLLINSFEVPQVENVYFAERHLHLPAGSLSSGSRLFWPLALAGAVLLVLRRRVPRDLLLLAGSYAVSLLAFFITWRHRLPLLPMASCFAAFALARCSAALRAGTPRAHFGNLAMVGSALVVCNLDPALGTTVHHGGPFAVPSDYLEFPTQHNNLSTVLLERGDPDGAAIEARRGLAYSPRHPALWLNLAHALAARGDLSEASAAAESSLAHAPGQAAALTFVGELRLERGNDQGARQVLERAVLADPSSARAWATLGLARDGLGDAAGAFAALREAIRLSPRWTDPRHNLALLLARHGRHAEAMAEARGLLTVDRSAATQDFVRWLDAQRAAVRPDHALAPRR